MFSGEKSNYSKHLESSTVPHGFVRFSDAIGRLADGRWGGLRRPAPVRIAKLAYKRASIGFGPWREVAGQELTAAVKEGKLDVYVCVTRGHGHSEPMALPVTILAQLITTRGSLSDHPIRPSLITTAGAAKLLHLLTKGILTIRTSDFEAWYRSERAKGKWPSQPSKSNPRRAGRPTKRTEGLRNGVIKLVRDGQWSGKKSVPELRRLLGALGNIAPSVDTIARLVDQLHSETGESDYRRNKRRRKRMAPPIPQKPLPESNGTNLTVAAEVIAGPRFLAKGAVDEFSAPDKGRSAHTQNPHTREDGAATKLVATAPPLTRDHEHDCKPEYPQPADGEGSSISPET
jgi:hypothetical protein